MEIGIISFTEKGKDLARRAAGALEGTGHSCDITFWEKGMSLSAWAGRQWQSKEGLLFIGAAGIAVRTIAPFLKDKFTDPAVVVMDEKGRFAIPLVSGHVGGANALARTLGQVLGTVPVITTATDVNGIFAVDMFAKENHLYLSDRFLAKQISADLLAGRSVGWRRDWGNFPMPEGFVPVGRRTDAGEEYTYREAWELPEGLGTAVWITISSLECPGWLKLIPKAVIVGLGCRKDIPFQNLNQAVDQMLADYHVSDQAVLGIATIDRKAREPAVLELIKKRSWNLFAYTAEELEAVPGVFPESEFVRKTVGTGNVCQRAALLSGGRLIAEKTRFPGITMALALCEQVPDGRKRGDKKEDKKGTDP